MSAFDWLDERNARQLIGSINDYVTKDAEARDKAADQRHADILAIVGAVAVGLRATADALDQVTRRRR